MEKALLYLDENLASSIALRYAARIKELFDLRIYIAHVEEPDKKQQAGTGWVRRTWEKGVREAGLEAVKRLLRTEKVDLDYEGQPMVFVGDLHKELIDELRVGGYGLYIEGNVAMPDSGEFHELLTSAFFKEIPCPVILAKNLPVTNTVGLLMGDGVDHGSVIAKMVSLAQGRSLQVDLVYFKFKEGPNLEQLGEAEAGSSISEAFQALTEGGHEVVNRYVLLGPPEKAGDFLKNYAFVSSSFPTRRSPMEEVLATTPASLFLAR